MLGDLGSGGGGFTLLNDSELPVICFTHPRIEANVVRGLDVLDRVLRGGRAWISYVVTVHRASRPENDYLTVRSVATQAH